MSEAAFIKDGYTKTVGIDRAAGLYPALEFTFRPFHGPEVVDALKLIQSGPSALSRNPRKHKPERIRKEQSSEEVRGRLFDAMISRMVSWSFDRPIDRDALFELNPALFNRLNNIVFGYDAPDYELDAEGKRIDPVSEEDDEKN